MENPQRILLLRTAQGMIGKFAYDKAGLREANGLPKADDEVMDCSEFVYSVYQRAGISGFNYLNSHGIARSDKFEKVDVPRPGDIVYWPQGHVAIVENPETGEFIGSQSSTGVARSNYKTNVYWGSRSGRSFFRLKTLQ